MLVAGAQAGVARLQGKARFRKKGGAGGMLGMYPAGAGELGGSAGEVFLRQNIVFARTRWRTNMK